MKPNFLNLENSIILIFFGRDIQEYFPILAQKIQIHMLKVSEFSPEKNCQYILRLKRFVF